MTKQAKIARRTERAFKANIRTVEPETCACGLSPAACATVSCYKLADDVGELRAVAARAQDHSGLC